MKSVQLEENGSVEIRRHDGAVLYVMNDAAGSFKIIADNQVLIEPGTSCSFRVLTRASKRRAKDSPAPAGDQPTLPQATDTEHRKQ